MASRKFRCRHCEFTSELRWRGRCPGCGGYYNIVAPSLDDDQKGRVSLADLGDKTIVRISTGIPEFDKVLGGGLVRGSSFAIIGPPGSGKTTLLLQTADNVAKYFNKLSKAAQAALDLINETGEDEGAEEDESGKKKAKVLYTSGEQNRDDIGMAAKRIGALNPNVDVMGNEGDLYKIVAEAEERKPKFMVVDSAQTAYCEDVESDVGSARQVEAVATYLTSFCKTLKIPCGLVCHVNKDGDMAGPKRLEHFVDAVMFIDPLTADDLEEDEDPEVTFGCDPVDIRVLSSGKNRNGASGVKAFLQMTATGLKTPPKMRTKSRLVLV